MSLASDLFPELQGHPTTPYPPPLDIQSDIQILDPLFCLCQLFPRLPHLS